LPNFLKNKNKMKNDIQLFLQKNIKKIRKHCFSLLCLPI